MNEYFLQYLWKNKLIKHFDLKGTQNERIEIISFGFQNNDAGPDFGHCKIKINNTIWVGNIEIHVKASDWLRHMHHIDKKYDNIILHVVYEHDMDIQRSNGEHITSLCIKGLFDENLHQNFSTFYQKHLKMPCLNYIADVDESLKKIWLQKLLLQRLEFKTNEVLSMLDKNLNDWQQVFYEILLRNFGFKINDMAFELLAKSLQYQVIAKHRDNLFQIEALLLGQAGFLENPFNDMYMQELQKEYHFLKQKFSLSPIDVKLWKMSKLRPSNFPYIRLAQLAFLFHKTDRLFSKLLTSESVKNMYAHFHIKTSAYWQTHYVPDKPSLLKEKNLGRSSVDNVLINTVVPVLFAYADKKNDEDLKIKTIGILESLQAENNNIIRFFMKAGLKAQNASESQAIITLKNNYCTFKKCTDCMIGHEIIQKIGSNT